MSDYPITRPLMTMPRDWERRTAFSSAAGALDFAALRRGMLGFAGWLVREAGVKPGDRVAICLPKSLEAVQAIYGVLAAGGAYVGMQFRGPPARLGAIIAATTPRLLLTTPEMGRQLAAEGGLPKLPPVLHIEAGEAGHGLDALLRPVPPLGETVPVGPADLGAIVFTSGSTGEPKGVMRSHRGMVANSEWHLRADGLNPLDVRLGNTSLHYLSPNLFYPPASGCRVHLLADEVVMFPELVAEAVERERITIWASSATALRLLIERGDLGRRNLDTLRLVKSHGELLRVDLLRTALAAFPQASVRTGYGSTEAPNITSYEAPRPLPDDMRDVPLGTVQEGYEMRLCDEDGVAVPPGHIGEICAIGPSVALGYWNDPVLTAAKRLNGQPYSYRTGDLGYLEPNGMLRFVGRKDHMVKLRGHRFDLGEVEAALRQHPAVREAAAVIVPRTDGESEILAAVEAAGSAGLDAALRQICADRLPRFAWPARILFPDELPRLPNGKIDRLKLPAILERAPAAS
jgi:clorobiocin biosynthesis protein CloN4